MQRFITEIEEASDLLNPADIKVKEQKVRFKLCECGCGRLFEEHRVKRFFSQQHSRVQRNRERRKT